jgi:predicted Zn finger-like uncharacterized protein
MSIKTTCPECQARFTLEDELEGKKIRCRSCQAVFGPISRRDEEPVREKERTTTRRREEDERPASRKREADRLVRRIKKPAGTGMPVAWLIGAVLGLIVFIGAVVGGILWMVQQQSGDTDSAATAAVSGAGPLAGGPNMIAFQGKDGDPHEVPAGPFPPPGFPPADSALSEDNTVSVDNPILDVSKEEKELPAAKPPKISAEAKATVKKGTVYIRVTRAGGGGSGSGFFASAEAPNLVVTNAHVVGMLEPGTGPPNTIDVVVNSGQKEEKTYKGKLIGLDRTSDLAVIDIGVKEGLPKPLKVRTATSVQELDEVYVFGFPLGERLGKEITIRDTSVSSLRKRNGMLDRIQTKGGMDPGNSGGPVVDTNGHVVGVAVAIIVGREIQFAVPSDRVLGILYGRVRSMGIGQPIKTGEKITAPIRIETIDPRGQIKQAGVEVWTGNPPPKGKDRTRPPATSQPPQLPGDSPRKESMHRIVAGKGDFQENRVLRNTVELPPLPPGKVYWVQPKWIRATGETLWGSAWVYKGGEPLLPKEVDLRTRYTESEAGRRVLLSVVDRIYAEDNDTPEVTTTVTAGFIERVVNATPAGPTLALFYQGAAKSMVQNAEDHPDPFMDTVRSNLNVMKARVQLDANGKVMMNQFVTARTAQGDANMHRFHDAVKEGLDPAFLPLPNKLMKPRETWQANQMRLNLGDESTRIHQSTVFNLTCTYLGTRSRAGREEAVIGIFGPSFAAARGVVHGQMVVDVATGTVRSVELNAVADVPSFHFVGGQVRNLKVRLTKVIRLQRDL